MTEAKWRKINLGLFVAIVFINLYTIVLPTLPGISYWWQARHGKVPVTATVSQYVQASTNKPKPAENSLNAGGQTGNRLVIPRMLMNTAIIEGPTNNPYGNLKKGAWHLPFSSTPDKGGNMVIAGHRFTYTEARSIFYYLDKLQVGDEIGIQWDGKMYVYKVESTTVLPPTSTNVQNPTDDMRLTLYTCTPLWNPKNRLVVVAKPIEGGN